jgi:hypothetical protein
MSKVTVYFYKHIDDDLNDDKRSKRMASLPTIARIKGHPLMDTGIEIDESALDAYGFYIPKR